MTVCKECNNDKDIIYGCVGCHNKANDRRGKIGTCECCKKRTFTRIGVSHAATTFSDGWTELVKWCEACWKEDDEFEKRRLSLKDSEEEKQLERDKWDL